MSYPEMCFAAERTGVLPNSSHCAKIFLKNRVGKIETGGARFSDWSKEKEQWKYIPVARSWTCEELWGMLGDAKTQWGFGPIPNAKGCALSYPVKNFSKVQYFPSLQEALLFAVMFERGFLWNAAKKEFERRAK